MSELQLKHCAHDFATVLEAWTTHANYKKSATTDCQSSLRGSALHLIKRHPQSGSSREQSVVSRWRYKRLPQQKLPICIIGQAVHCSWCPYATTAHTVYSKESQIEPRYDSTVTLGTVNVTGRHWRPHVDMASNFVVVVVGKKMKTPQHDHKLRCLKLTHLLFCCCWHCFQLCGDS